MDTYHVLISRDGAPQLAMNVQADCSIDAIALVDPDMGWGREFTDERTGDSIWLRIDHGHIYEARISPVASTPAWEVAS